MTVFVTKPDPYIRRCHHLKNSFTNDARQGDCAFASYPEQCYKKTAENCIGNGPQETSVNITAKTPAAPDTPQAHDQLLAAASDDKDDAALSQRAAIGIEPSRTHFAADNLSANTRKPARLFSLYYDNIITSDTT